MVSADSTYQKQIVLDQVVLVVFNWKRPIAHLLHKLMLGVLFPRLLDVVAIEQVLYESTSARVLVFALI